MDDLAAEVAPWVGNGVRSYRSRLHSHVGHVALPPGTAVFVADSGLIRPVHARSVGRPGD